MSTTFHTPINNVSTTVGTAYTAGSHSLVVATGTGSQFGSTFPLIITASLSGSVLSILEVTGRSTDTLTISNAIEGTTDVNLAVGVTIEMRPTALAVTELQSAVHTLETTGATVTSVALTMPTGFSVSGSPITTSGTLAVTTALSGILKAASGGITTATSGTDYLTPTGNGSGLTNLTASNLSSGTVPTARLGSGTASSSTFLRGDSTWATGGGGGGSPGGSEGDLQWNHSSAFAGGGPTWDGSNILAITTAAAEYRVANDATHYGRITRSATGNVLNVYNKVITPSATLYAILLNGTSQSLQLAAAVGGNYNLTLAGWIKTTSAASTSISPNNPALPVFGWTDSGSQAAFGVTSGKAEYRIYSSGVQTITGTATVNDGTWHHIALTYESSPSGAITIYVDNVVDTTATVIQGSPGGIKFNLLGAGTGGDYFDGSISDLYLYQRVLDASEITSLYEFTDPDSTSILGKYLLTEGSGSTTADTSGNGNTATLENAPSWVDDNPQPATGTLVEAQVIASSDGDAASEAGIHRFGDPAGRHVILGSRVDVQLGESGTPFTLIDGAANVVLGAGALATSATDGFAYISSGAGAPTAKTGFIPLYFDSTNNYLYIYNGGSWKKTSVFA